MLSILLILPACATPLTSAAGNGNVERTKQLLEHGANPNEYDGGGVTPLAQAAYAGHYAIVRELLSHGANPKLAVLAVGENQPPRWVAGERYRSPAPQEPDVRLSSHPAHAIQKPGFLRTRSFPAFKEPDGRLGPWGEWRDSP